MQQADDFLAESEALHALLSPLPESDYARKTQFKGWSIDDILQHLHYFNLMADYSLSDPDRFDAEWRGLEALRSEGASLVEATDQLLGGLKGRALLAAWAEQFRAMTPRFAAADPKQRVKWVGPDMSARSSITARLMETWAHAQAIYDLLGVRRQNADRIRNIAHLGVATFGWTFQNRGEPVPETLPHVVLTAPSGALWEWGDPASGERIEGLAEEFCQVVTQTRNIADTALKVTGPVAARWMAITQCFAGPPEEPPAPGARGPAKA